MTREKAKKMLPVIQAFAEGKEIVLPELKEKQMTDKQIRQRFKETYPDFMLGDEPLSPYFDIWEYAIEIATKEQQEHHKKVCKVLTNAHRNLIKKIVSLKKQIEKAKEIIREYVNWDYGDHTNCLPDITKKAEAFLKE